MINIKKLPYCNILFAISLFIIFSCDVQEQWFLDVPDFDNNSEFTNTVPLSEKSKYIMEGIYKVTTGNDFFGDTLVLKQTRNKMSVFGLRNGCYCIIDAESNETKIILEGYWRYALNDRTGLVRFHITGADNILKGDTTLTNISISGVYGNNQSAPDIPVEFHLIKKITSALRADRFIITAHRGGGRTADHLPFSENSVAMVNYTEYFGSTGIEVDIELTKDKVPVLYHDDDLNIRLVQKTPLYGSLRDYTLAQLRSFVKLIHGEDIPTLEEALEAVLNNTKINLVLLDIKDEESLKYVIQLQQKYLDQAKKSGRLLDILISIRSEKIYKAFLLIEGFREIPSSCCLTTDKVNAIGAKIWNFRWTMGLNEQEVPNMHAQGRRCMVWTLDVPEFIDIYTSHGGTDTAKRFDGILTNYPTILAYYHYVRHNF
jgi:glycerophosphoryl diester phosphodiesterase